MLQHRQPNALGPWRIRTTPARVVLTFTVLYLTATAQAQTPTYGTPITLEQARRAIAAGVAEARKQNLTMAIAVIDSGGQLVAFERMDNTQLGSIALAQDKALTAVLFRRSTKTFENTLTGATDGGVWLPLMTLRNVTAVEGGIPIVVNGKVIGSVGVSGGRAMQDGVVAQAACDSLVHGK